ncbi:hypothetical protein ACFE04_011404 [Oxalis oulophora]
MEDDTELKSSDDEAEENQKKRKAERDPRGVAVCKKLKKMRETGIVHIDFNRWSNPYAPNGKMYSSYLGVITRQTIPLNITSWPRVEASLKEQLWVKLISMFNVSGDMRWAALAHASKLWRGWKSNLNQDYVQPRRLTNPETMSTIPKHLVTTVLEGVLNPQSSDVWMRARMTANGEPIDKRLIMIFNKINELKALQVQGKLVLGDEEDILSRVVRFFNLSGYLVRGG